MKADYNDKKKRKIFSYSIFSFSHYVMIFAGVAFVTSLAIIVFFWGVKTSFPKELLIVRARFAFINIFFLSLAFTFIIRVYRKIQVERPVKDILLTTEKIKKGDFSARVPQRFSFHFSNEFDKISENLNIMASELSGVETLKTDFIANVSHELKTPLSVIQNYATIMQDSSVCEEKRIEYAKNIMQASCKLSTLITNILKLNKLENQQIFPEKQHFNISEQVTECLLEFESIWDAKQIEIDAKIEDNLFLDSDPELLSLIWHNLFSNAFKFTDSGGIVGVSVCEDKEKIKIEIYDTGCGIDSENIKHIFEKFYQGDSSHATQGNGLGLALVKKVIDITGGSIKVESQKNKGSKFTVIF
ncbi:MAG: HAMP domain-containing histidine kinase [Treponema sp.]|nr:HAMP domain-containing histidine kinase [Treponema sp.]